MLSKSEGFLKHLDELGEDGVRDALTTHEFGDISDPANWRVITANNWLSSKTAARDSKIKEMSFEILKQQTALAAASAASAQEQARWAKWAAIIATVAAVVATKDQIFALIL
jgi:hypothetical protein